MEWPLDPIPSGNCRGQSFSTPDTRLKNYRKMHRVAECGRGEDILGPGLGGADIFTRENRWDTLSVKMTNFESKSGGLRLFDSLKSNRGGARMVYPILYS